MPHRFDLRKMEHHLRHLEQVQIRLQQQHQQLEAQLNRITREQEELKQQRAPKQQRAELKQLHKNLVNELLSVMDAQLEVSEGIAETSRFMAGSTAQETPPRQSAV